MVLFILVTIKLIHYKILTMIVQKIKSIKCKIIGNMMLMYWLIQISAYYLLL